MTIVSKVAPLENYPDRYMPITFWVFKKRFDRPRNVSVSAWDKLLTATKAYEAESVNGSVVGGEHKKAYKEVLQTIDHSVVLARLFVTFKISWSPVSENSTFL
jgi:hypothetical protein